MHLPTLRAHSSELLRVDLLRFVASLGIVWHHSHEFLYPLARRAEVHGQTRALALFVDMFFAISGFVISYVYANRPMDARGYGRFLQRRMSRLVPLHWLTFAITWSLWAMIVHRGMRIDHPPDLSSACSVDVLLLMQSAIPCGNNVFPNGVTWSISVEVLLYLCFPVLLAMCRRRVALGIWAVALAVLTLWAMARTAGVWDDAPALLRGALSFTIGMNLFLYRHAIARVPAGSTAVLTLLAMTLAMMMTGVPQPVVLCTLYVLVAAAVAADMRSPPVGAVRFVAPLGQMTYSIYMWHSLIITILLNGLGDKLLKLHGFGMLSMMIVCYAGIMIVSYFSWALFEGPVRRFFDRLGPLGRQAPYKVLGQR